MGNCFAKQNDGEKEAAQRSAQIDRQIEQDGKKLKKECKILLLGMFTLSTQSSSTYLGHLGSSESGKSTIVKQMRIIHQDGFSHDTKLTYREAIYSNLLESAQAVATAMHKFKVEPADPSNVVGPLSDSRNFVSFSNPILYSQHWDKYSSMTSMSNCSLTNVHLPTPSQVSLQKLSIVSGRTKRSKSLLTITGHSST